MTISGPAAGLLLCRAKGFYVPGSGQAAKRDGQYYPTGDAAHKQRTA